MNELRLVVVTGLSGSGKSTAIKVLEDLGFYCIDNLPVALIPRFVEVWESSSEEVRRVALGLDVRERHFLDEFPRIFEELRARGVALEVLYLEASDDVLVRRFSETRRPHPAAGGGILADGIRREREKLRPLREVASRILDTSALTVHELRSALRDLVERPEAGTMTIALVSFGYKYGLPTDADHPGGLHPALRAGAHLLGDRAAVRGRRGGSRLGAAPRREPGVPRPRARPPRLHPAALPA